MLVEIVIFGFWFFFEEVDKLIKEKIFFCEDVFEFYEFLVEDICEMYGIVDFEEFEKMVMESEDLWFEEYVWDLRMYYVFKG